MKKTIIFGFILLLFLSYIGLARAVDVVPATPTFISDAALPPSFVNQPYSYNFSVTGGLTPYTFTIISGSLPNGLNLNSATGGISGTPTVTGSFNFSLQVVDSNSNSATQNATLTIVPPSNGFIYTRIPDVNPAPSPISYRIQGIFGLDFCAGTSNGHNFTSYSLAASPKSGSPYGNFVAHSQGDIADDIISINADPGSYGIYLVCLNQYGPVWSNILTTVDVVRIIITNTSLVNASIGNNYLQSLQSYGGVYPLTWVIQTGILPSGLSLNPSTGEIPLQVKYLAFQPW